MEIFVVEVTVGLTVRFSVANESHPDDETNVVVCDPAALKVKPFQLYGNDAGQIAMFVVDVTAGLTVRFNVANESQPVMETNVAVCEPAATKVKPFQLYGNDVGQMVIFVVEVTVGLTVKFNVANESQPVAENNVAV
jgi:hypothetical protein